MVGSKAEPTIVELMQKKPVKASCRAGGGRTHTVSPPTDFKSVASAYSATAPKFVRFILPLSRFLIVVVCKNGGVAT